MADWLLQRPELLDAERVFILDVLASMPYIQRDAYPFLDQAYNEWLPAAEAIVGKAENESLRATRGLLLVLKREFAEAEDLLMPIAERNTGRDEAVAPCLGMAISRAWQGDTEGSEHWLERVRPLKQYAPLVETAEDYIRTPPPCDTDSLASETAESNHP